MAVHALILLAALTVKQDSTPLRSGCDADAPVTATLPAGTTVEVRFRLSDGSDCFKIAATLDGKPVTGYVPGAALANVEQFDQQRASAASIQIKQEINQALKPVAAQTAALVARVSDPALGRAVHLIEANQPAEALEILAPAAKRYPRNPDVLLIAGIAAYRADQLRPALDYWKQSLDLAPNDQLARVYEKVRRETESDRSNDKIYGLHFALRYEGETVPADTARAMLGTLDGEFNRVSSQLGCSAVERITVIVQTRDAYLKSSGAAEWSGGQYDGRIHVALMEGADVGPRMRRTLTHELVHACLANIAPGGRPWPAWLQEGLAQKLSGETLSTQDRELIHRLAESHALPRLENLRQDWSLLNMENARVAYNLALAAADALFDNYSTYGIRNVVNNPQTLGQITAELDKRLGL
jgi:tetratricopeptide (TPR) repeat protein